MRRAWCCMVRQCANKFHAPVDEIWIRKCVCGFHNVDLHTLEPARNCALTAHYLFMREIASEFSLATAGANLKLAATTCRDTFTSRLCHTSCVTLVGDCSTMFWAMRRSPSTCRTCTELVLPGLATRRENSKSKNPIEKLSPVCSLAKIHMDRKTCCFFAGTYWSADLYDFAVWVRSNEILLRSWRSLTSWNFKNTLVTVMSFDQMTSMSLAITQITIFSNQKTATTLSLKGSGVSLAIDCLTNF